MKRRDGLGMILTPGGIISHAGRHHLSRREPQHLIHL